MDINKDSIDEKILFLLENSKEFTYENEKFEIVKVGIPYLKSRYKTDVKTNIYILAKNNQGEREFKISVLSKGINKYQKNKVGKERAESLFGYDYQEIIKKSTTFLKEQFETIPLLYSIPIRSRKADSITVGWKLQLSHKPTTLSTPLFMSEKETKDILYKGNLLPETKKNAYIQEQLVENSGMPDYLLYTNTNEISTIEDIFNNILLIDEATIYPTYLSFTAVNYSARDGKYDMSRPLAVRINWSIKENKLNNEVRFDNPLEFTAKDVVEKQLIKSLEILGKYLPSEMTNDDIRNTYIL